MKNWAAAFVALFTMSAILFGDPFKPLGYALGAWRTPPMTFLIRATAGGVVCALVGVSALRRFAPKQSAKAIEPTLAVLITIGIAVVILSYETNLLLQRAIAALAPERVLTHSLGESLHNVPREFQFYLHAAALKNCRPYAWSYSEMAFYELPSNTAINVLPHEWIEDCRIVRKEP